MFNECCRGIHGKEYSIQKSKVVLQLLHKLLKSVMQSTWMIWERIFAFISRFRSSHISHFGICTVMIK
ncbi:polysaccharide deacetylase [Paenibacillus vortex V453]|uniref:Polysaccharide deacetylase n=1 Tax=Paenibacillus vortex V453 TaxID=715225 RepID=A0A2R9SQN8_9BACL|nr:polysaccharide deacetylase [Paenibacillus vortex V453]